MDELVMERRLTEAEARSKSNTKRIDDLEKIVDLIHELATGMAVVKTEQREMKSDIADIKTSVTTIAEKPGKRWDKAVEAVVLGIISVLVGFLMAKAGIF